MMVWKGNPLQNPLNSGLGTILICSDLYLLFSPLGEDEPMWTSIFLKGLKPPTRLHQDRTYTNIYIWSNYSDLTWRPQEVAKRKGNSLISGKSRLVNHYNLARFIWLDQEKKGWKNWETYSTFKKCTNHILSLTQITPTYPGKIFSKYQLFQETSHIKAGIKWLEFSAPGQNTFSSKTWSRLFLIFPGSCGVGCTETMCFTACLQLCTQNIA